MLSSRRRLVLAEKRMEGSGESPDGAKMIKASNRVV